MTANLPDSTTEPSTPTESVVGAWVRNLLIVLVAIVLSVAIFLGFRTQTTSVSLTAIAEDSVPLEVALGNGKPTLMEFYANWCTSCQAMAPDVEALKQQYGERVNFVMLNVDNAKWLPEMLHYRVDGIPYFVFLGQGGETIASTIGEQPRAVMDANILALAEGSSLPYAQTSGQTSAFSAPTPVGSSGDDPRSHGSQVVN